MAQVMVRGTENGGIICELSGVVVVSHEEKQKFLNEVNAIFYKYSIYDKAK